MATAAINYDYHDVGAATAASQHAASAKISLVCWMLLETRMVVSGCCSQISVYVRSSFFLSDIMFEIVAIYILFRHS